jgi:hypothetical protein
MHEQKRKLLIWLCSSLATVCAATAGVLGYMLLKPQGEVRAEAEATKFYIRYIVNEDTEFKETYEETEGRDMGSNPTVNITTLSLDAMGINCYGHYFGGWGINPPTSPITKSDGTYTKTYNLEVSKGAIRPDDISGKQILELYAITTIRDYNVTFNAISGKGKFGTAPDAPSTTNTVVQYGAELGEDGGSGAALTKAGANTDDFSGWFLGYDDNAHDYRIMVGTKMAKLTDNGFLAYYVTKGSSAENYQHKIGTENVSPFNPFFTGNTITLYAGWSAGRYPIYNEMNSPKDE